MDFVVPSLPEAAYLYTGLALQALVRGTLRVLPQVMVLAATIGMIARGGLRQERAALGRAVGYVLMACLILVLFWPEAVRFGRAGVSTAPDQVASYAAQQDARATVITAADSGLVPTPLRSGAPLAPGFDLILKALTETHLALARAINSQAHRPFAPLLPLQWLLTQKPSSEATAALADWVEQCYKPAQTAMLQRAGGEYTYQDFLPWGTTPLASALEVLQVTPGSHTGLLPRIQTWLGLGETPVQVSCYEYLTQVETALDQWVEQQPSPSGSGATLSAVWEQALGLPRGEQVRFLIYRDLLQAIGESPPNLTGRYAALRATRVGAEAAIGLLQGYLGGGGLRNGLAGGLSGVTNEFSRVFDGLNAIVGLATWLTWWGPYVLGMVNMVLIALFPLAVLWALLPSNSGQALAAYFAALAWTTATPLWWALIDAAARLAGTSSSTPVSAPWSLAQQFVAPLMITALGVIAIPVATALAIFGTYRALGGFWRSGG